MASQKSFLQGRFFDEFCVAEKIQKRRPGGSAGSPRGEQKIPQERDLNEQKPGPKKARNERKPRNKRKTSKTPWARRINRLPPAPAHAFHSSQCVKAQTLVSDQGDNQSSCFFLFTNIFLFFSSSFSLPCVFFVFLVF